MPRFAWTATDAEGSVIKGSTVALDPKEVADQLRRDGYSVLSVTRRSWPPTNVHIETVSRRDLISFTYKIVPLLASNLALNRVLDITREEVKKFRIKNALVSIKQDVGGGLRLSQAMDKHPDIFSRPYVSAVRAGEESGNLSGSLTMMGAFLEWFDDIVKQLWALISYPLLVLAAIMVLNFVLAFFAIPTFLNLYERLGLRIQMPLPTKIVFAYSKFMKDFWPLFAILGAAAIVLFALRGRYAGLRFQLHRLTLKVPFWGDIVRRMQSLQFCRFFLMLYENGVDVKRGLSEASGVLTNDVMLEATGFISRRLEEGATLSQAFQESGEFPSLVAEQLRVGEESGDIGNAIKYIVRYYESELNYSIQRFTTFLRPAMVVVLAFVLLMLALAFYLPLFEIANLIQQRQPQ